jgi:muconolactone D-isomerase
VNLPLVTHVTVPKEDAESIDRLHELLSGLPLYPYLGIRVTPLATRPSAL